MTSILDRLKASTQFDEIKLTCSGFQSRGNEVFKEFFRCEMYVEPYKHTEPVPPLKEIRVIELSKVQKQIELLHKVIEKLVEQRDFYITQVMNLTHEMGEEYRADWSIKLANQELIDAHLEGKNG